MKPDAEWLSSMLDDAPVERTHRREIAIAVENAIRQVMGKPIPKRLLRSVALPSLRERISDMTIEELREKLHEAIRRNNELEHQAYVHLREKKHESGRSRRERRTLEARAVLESHEGLRQRAQTLQRRLDRAVEFIAHDSPYWIAG